MKAQASDTNYNSRFYAENIRNESKEVIEEKSDNQSKDEIICAIGNFCKGKSIHRLGEPDKKYIKDGVDQLGQQTSSLFRTIDSAAKIYACVLLYRHFTGHIPANLSEVRGFLNDTFTGENEISIHDGSFAFRDLSQKYFNQIIKYFKHPNDRYDTQLRMEEEIHNFRSIVDAFGAPINYKMTMIDEYRYRYFEIPPSNRDCIANHFGNILLKHERRAIPDDLIIIPRENDRNNPHVVYTQLIIQNRENLISQNQLELNNLAAINELYPSGKHLNLFCSRFNDLYCLKNNYEFYTLEWMGFLYNIERSREGGFFDGADLLSISLLKDICHDFLRYYNQLDSAGKQRISIFMHNSEIFHYIGQFANIGKPIENLRQFCEGFDTK